MVACSNDAKFAPNVSDPPKWPRPFPELCPVRGWIARSTNAQLRNAGHPPASLFTARNAPLIHEYIVQTTSTKNYTSLGRMAGTFIAYWCNGTFFFSPTISSIRNELEKASEHCSRKTTPRALHSTRNGRLRRRKIASDRKRSRSLPERRGHPISSARKQTNKQTRYRS